MKIYITILLFLSLLTGCSRMNWHVNDPTSIEDGTLATNWGISHSGRSHWRYSYEAGSYYDTTGVQGPSPYDLTGAAVRNALSR